VGRTLRDATFAVVLSALTLPVAWLAERDRPIDGAGAALALAATLPLALRRRWPVAVLVAVACASVGYHAGGYPHDPLLPPMLVALYTVASTGGRVRSAAVGAAVGALVIAIAVATRDADVIDDAGWLAAALVLGEVVRVHRRYVTEVEDRAERAERTREAEAHRRATEERLRIARDLHDVLAHSITQVHVQAGVAAHLVGTGQAERDTLAATLEQIVATCRTARLELQLTLGVLRVDGADVQEPVPGLAGIHDLTDRLRATGVDVVVDVVGEATVPAPVDVAAYRITQEAVTNIMKHSGARTARIEIRHDPDALRLRIADDGTRSTGSRPGHGIRGMTERAATIGGRVTTQHGKTGGFTVTAELPLHPGNHR
jgi:signal transduction histidine kinase